MCGRYNIKTEHEIDRFQEMIERANASLPSGLRLTRREEGDVYPTDITPAIVERDGEIITVAMRWGFKTSRGLVINARAETAFEKPLFRDSAHMSRCLLPATGYYEWNAHKERFLFRRPDCGVLYLAGLFRLCDDGVPEYVILTREASEEAGAIHARMPLIASLIGDWLSDRVAAAQLIKTGGDTRLEIERQSPQQLSMFDDF